MQNTPEYEAAKRFLTTSTPEHARLLEECTLLRNGTAPTPTLLGDLQIHTLELVPLVDVAFEQYHRPMEHAPYVYTATNDIAYYVGAYPTGRVGGSPDDNRAVVTLRKVEDNSPAASTLLIVTDLYFTTEHDPSQYNLVQLVWNMSNPDERRIWPYGEYLVDILNLLTAKVLNGPEARHPTPFADRMDTYHAKAPEITPMLTDEECYRHWSHLSGSKR